MDSKEKLENEQANALHSLQTFTSRDVMISRFMASIATNGNDQTRRRANGMHTLLNSKMDSISANHGCDTDSKNLKPIKLSELKINKLHFGCVLYARVVTPLLRTIAVHLLIEDNDCDNVCLLGLYNLAPQTMDLITFEKNHLPINSLIAIKEPYFKAFQSRQVGIRIDNPHFNLRIIKPNELKQFESIQNKPRRSIKWYFD